MRWRASIRTLVPGAFGVAMLLALAVRARRRDGAVPPAARRLPGTLRAEVAALREDARGALDDGRAAARARARERHPAPSPDAGAPAASAPR